MKKVYVDTSVFGGYFDEEFSRDTQPFFNEVSAGLHIVVVSALTVQELELAPENVISLFQEVPSEIIPTSEEAFQLGRKYIEEGAITEKYFSDAVHIALSSLNQIDTIISWNFKHMVNVNRIRLYNATNLKYGYPMVDIRTPKEIIYGEE